MHHSFALGVGSARIGRVLPPGFPSSHRALGAAVAEPFVLVSFDNHPDWDVRPPRWCCGGWVNRALELPQRGKSLRVGLRELRVLVAGPAFRQSPGGARGTAGDQSLGGEPLGVRIEARRGAILRANWRERFAAFVQALGDSNLYVTIDLDCLRAEDAITNWENGSFTLEDLAWALTQLRASRAKILGGDICGAFSPPFYARREQRFLAEMDHPRLPVRDLGTATRINLRAFEALWPLLAVGGSRAPRAMTICALRRDQFAIVRRSARST